MRRHMRMMLSHPQWRTAVGAVLASFVAREYVETCFAGIPGGDAGELVAEACQLGVPHPPGYPLFVYAARIAVEALKPAGYSAAKSVNLLCCAFGVAVSVLLYDTGCQLQRLMMLEGRSATSPASLALVAGLAAAAAALSPLQWYYFTGAEVFALNNLLVALLMWHGSCYAVGLATHSLSESCRRGYTLVGSLLCGLALTNQHTSVLFILPLAGWVLITRYGELTVKEAASHVAAFMLGLLPYAHMPIWHRFYRGPGSWGDTTSLRGFLRHLLRSDYGTFRLLARTDKAVEGFSERNAAYLLSLWQEQLPTGTASLVLVGMLAGAVLAVRSCCGKRVAPASATGGCGGNLSPWRAACGRAYIGFLAFAFLFYFCVFHSLSNMPLSDPLLYGVHARFWMQPNLIAFVLLPVGLSACCEVLTMALCHLLGGHGRGKQGASQSKPTPPSGKLRDGGAPPAAADQTSAAEASPVTAAHSTVQLVISGLVCTIFGALLWRQWVRVRPLVDNSSNDVIARYGRALIEPLPRDSILLTGYDHQWTSLRYLQSCEGVRPDVDVFNGAILSFSWFQAAHRAYPRVNFPGTHLVSHMSALHAAGGFSLADFLAANTQADGGEALLRSYAADPPHPDFLARRQLGNAGSRMRPQSGGVFMSGLSVFPGDSAHLQQWELLPYGIVEAAMPRVDYPRITTWRNLTALPGSAGAGASAGSSSASAAKRRQGEPPLLVAQGRPWVAQRPYANAAAAAWATAVSHFDGELSPLQYGGDSWEHAARLDFWTRAGNYATWLLEWSLQSSQQRGDAPLSPADKGGGADPDSEDDFDAMGTLNAASWIEAAIRHQKQDNVTVAAAHFKNAGLAYVRLVRSKHRFPAPPAVRWPCLPSPRDGVGALPPALHDESLPPRFAITEPLQPCSVPGNEETLRVQAARRVLDAWTFFLSTPEGGVDAGRATIVQVVATLRGALAPRTGGSAV